MNRNTFSQYQSYINKRNNFFCNAVILFQQFEWEYREIIVQEIKTKCKELNIHIKILFIITFLVSV